MANKPIMFRLTAYSDAAGKYDASAPLNGNEDNFYVDDDLGNGQPGRFRSDQELALSGCGCLLMVADGMGGMNAGEVASGIAVETVKEYFAPGRVSERMAASAAERRQRLEQVIVEADRRIKADAKACPEHDGMGSTIILAWIVGDSMTLSWCGDSRAYRYSPLNGLEPLSRDHSYVQELVNQGQIAYEDTFDHPQGNIVTRSLGDPERAARPETKEVELYDQDVILLCSDGLSGVLRDRRTKDRQGNYYPGENIEDTMAANLATMTQCRDALMAAAQRANWYDNVTVILCQIIAGARRPVKRDVQPAAVAAGHVAVEDATALPFYRSGRFRLMAAIGLAVVVAAGAGLYVRKTFFSDREDGGRRVADSTAVADGGQVVASTDVAPEVTTDASKEPAVAKPPEKKEGKVETGGAKKEEEGVSTEGKTQSMEEATPVKSEATAPAGNGVPQGELTPEWKIDLKDRLKNARIQGALKTMRQGLMDKIDRASAKDRESCEKECEKLIERARCLEELMGIGDKDLSPESSRERDKLKSEICNPDSYNPGEWRRRIKELASQSGDDYGATDDKYI